MIDVSLRPGSGTTGSPPIGDYALIGDCRGAGLVSRDGSLDWLCLPRYDSPALFAALLDAEAGGRFRIRPTGAFRAERRYLPDTAILKTTFLRPPSRRGSEPRRHPRLYYTPGVSPGLRGTTPVARAAPRDEAGLPIPGNSRRSAWGTNRRPAGRGTQLAHVPPVSAEWRPFPAETRSRCAFAITEHNPQ